MPQPDLDELGIGMPENDLDLGFDASDPKTVQAARSREGRRRKRMDNALAALLKTQDGRMWFWGKLNECHVLATPYVSNSPTDTAFACGEQNVGLKLFADLVRVAPEAYELMIKEQSEYV